MATSQQLHDFTEAELLNLHGAEHLDSSTLHKELV